MAVPPHQQPTVGSLPQLILPTPVLLTTTSSRGSFIISLPTRTAASINSAKTPLVPSILASTDDLSPTVGPATTVTPSPAESAMALPGAAQGAISDRSVQFPALLVAGVLGCVVVFIFLFALLWRCYIRQQSQRRHANTFADEKGLARPHGHDNPGGPYGRPADRTMTTEIWTGSKASKSDQNRFSRAVTEVLWDEELEPLSPKTVIQQTVHKVSVPAPVDASSFRNNSKESSPRGSVSRPLSALQQAVAREAAETQGSDGKHRSSARLSVPGTVHSPDSKDVSDQPGELEGDPGPDLSDLELVPAPLGKTKGKGPGSKRIYTLRSSPLNQNPFRDPVEDEEATETPMSVTFEIVDIYTSPMNSTPGNESGAQGDEHQEHSSSPMRVLQTITLTAEDLKRASTARTIAG
ncbi:hypothetical protein DHEL01_v210688 [Diaporthe helianthi]|uniref:Uncharacterized protein n=1 Tax=Diaporthe helianthi TaxID=158607 RepID=A0A2P5HKZ5_DIAHE|nr:hypothetical protein DHEL01_v210688 [Diaporthe helianthi]